MVIGRKRERGEENKRERGSETEIERKTERKTDKTGKETLHFRIWKKGTWPWGPLEVGKRGRK